MSLLERLRPGTRPAPPRVDDGAKAAERESLAEKLLRETRLCGTCGFTIANPMTDRCPRCFSHVALSEHTNCGECSHQGNCEVAKLMGKV